ncbi:PhnB protein [Catalinimonas alkaloidigena]|uniref:PhnB protein n=1 Tax=Catalinimonas alkaloidigena TaxID=1075417 RepID=A0A1G9H126_9BACT|nr:VOC family protein [Catalinimonas alkaloidigena]SDL06630.1 PhnB protein [Catalinimonas alkaloidigena]
MTIINPYLNFNGNCEEAFTFYKSVFGGDFVSLMRFQDAPGHQPGSAHANQIMHVSLPVGSHTILMGSDRPASLGEGAFGDNFSISIGTTSQAEADALFHGISADGHVTMPLDNTFWGAYFGMCTDKFGINWMVSYDPNALPAS